MSFVGGKSTLGPRGRRVRRGVAGGYVADDAAFSSGPGAIAAIDGATSRRKRARALAAHVSAQRDRKLAAMTMGAVPALTTLARAAGTLVKPLITAGAAIGSPAKVGMITPTTSKYPGMRPVVSRPMVGTPGSRTTIGLRPNIGTRSSEPPPIAITGSTPGSTPTPSQFTTDPGGSTCLTTSLLSNGYCPPTPSALPPATSSGGGGGGGGGSVDTGGGSGGGGAPPPPDAGDGGDGGPAIDTSELDTGTATTGTGVMTAPPPTPTPVTVTPAGMAALSGKNLVYLGAAAVAAWWLFFRK